MTNQTPKHVKYLGPPIDPDEPMSLDDAITAIRAIADKLEREVGPGGIPNPDPSDGLPRVRPGDPPLPKIQPVDGDLFPPED